jgi:putative transposase
VEERLTVRRKKRKRLVRDRAAEPRLTGANQEWAMDFIVDGLATGRMVRILSVVDAYTRECLALEADTSLGSGRVTRVLERLIEERGRPENVRSDNGPEFTSRRMLAWSETGRSGWCTSSQAVRCRPAMSRASTGGCATSVSTRVGSAP